MSDEAGVNKSAILLMSLGEAQAAEVLKLLEPKEVQKISAAMVSMKIISREMLTTVFDEFYQIAVEKTNIGMNSDEFVKNMLNQALGGDKAAGLLDRILHNADDAGIDSLKWMDPVAVAELVRNEHPQIIAAILVHLAADHAAAIVEHLPERARGEVILRIATLDGVQPAALRELNDVLSKLLSGNSVTKRRIKGGTKTAAGILNFLGSALENTVMETIRTHDADLAQKILDEMFVFENLLEMEDRGIQLVLREVQSESLIVALKGASEELREKIFKNMSQRASEMLRDDLEAKGPTRVSEVEAEQKEILKIVRRLSDEGQLSLGGQGEEAYV